MFESVVVLGAEPAAGSVAASGTGLAPGLVLGPGSAPESVASTVELSPAMLLAWAEAEPAGARSAALLDGVEPAGLDPGDQVRLAVAWARVEAHAAARRLAAVAAVAGPEPSTAALRPGMATPRQGSALDILRPSPPPLAPLDRRPIFPEPRRPDLS